MTTARTRAPRPTLPVLLLVLALVAAGCFAGGGQPPAAEGRLRVGLPFPPVAAMSPYSDDAVLATRLGVTEALTTLDTDGRARPALAASWTNPDPLTWRFALQRGVTFHDGTPLRAAEAAASLRRAAAASPVPSALAGVSPTVSAEGGPDGDTVVVRTAAPDPVLPQRLASPELVVLAPAAYADPARPSPVRAGTGPFVLTELGGTTTARLERFGAYRGGPARAAGVDVRFLAEGAARANALRAGELDVVQAIPVAQVPTVTGQEVRQVPLPRTVAASLNQRSPVLAEPGVRDAVRAALGTIDAAPTIYENLADPARGLFGPASPFASRRPAVASPAPGRGSGQPIRIATYSDRPELPELANAAVGALRQAGFAPELTVQEYSTIEPALLGGAFDLVVATRSYQVETGDPIGYLASDFGCRGSNNLAQHCDPAFDAALARAGVLADPTARQDAALRLEADLLSTGVVVPFVHERARVGVAPGVQGVAEDPLERQLITGATVRG